MNNQIATNVAVVAANAILAAIEAKGSLVKGDKDDTRFAKDISEVILKQGGSKAQRDWALRLVKRHGLKLPPVQAKPVTVKGFTPAEVAKQAPIAPVGVKDTAPRGPRLGGGGFREGFQHGLISMLVIKVGDQRHNSLEAERFNTAKGIVKSALCPSWLQGADVVMLRVTDYVDRGKFEQLPDGTWKHNRNGRVISQANIDALNAVVNEYGLWDNVPTGGCARTQGGWLGDWFVMTDYAL